MAVLWLIFLLHEFSVLAFRSPAESAIAKRIYLYGNWGAMEKEKWKCEQETKARRRRRRNFWTSSLM